MKTIMITRILLLFLVFLLNVKVAFSAEFKFNKKTYQRWGVSNYNEQLRLEIKKDNKTFRDYLRIAREDYVPRGLAQRRRVDTAFKLVSSLLNVEPDKVYYLKIKKRCGFGIHYIEINKE